MLIDELSKKIDSSDEEARREGVEGLVGMPFEPGILPLLKKALGDESWRVRKGAVNAAVSFQGDEAAVSFIAPLMIDVLSSEDNVGLRNSAVECLTRLGAKSVPYLMQNLNDRDHDVRKFIVDILGDIGTNMEQADRVGVETRQHGCLAPHEGIVDGLIIATKDPNENVRLSAIEGLGKIGSDRAVQALLDILEKGDMALKFTSLEALGNIGKPIPMKGVYNALNERLLKRAACDLIGKAGGVEAIPYLIEGLQENSPSTREAAMAALYRLAASLQISDLEAQISHLPSAALEKIASSVGSSDFNVSKGAVFVLGLTGKKEAVKHLVNALCFDELADEAGKALRQLVGEAPDVIDVIVDIYPAHDEKVRALLCDILGAIGNKKAENILVHAIKDDYGHVRSSAARALGKMDPEKAAQEIVKLLQDEFDDVRNVAADALCSLAKDSDTAVLAQVLPLLSMDDPYVREKAIIVLGRIGGSKEIERIRLAVKDDSPIVRKAAICAIEQRGDGRYVQDIILALADEDREVKLAATRALGALGSKEVVEPLLLLLTDEDIWVKAAAVESLGKIGKGYLVKNIRQLADNENGMIVCAALEAMARIAAREPQINAEIKPCAAKSLFHNDAEVVKVAAQILARIDPDGAAGAIMPLLEHSDWDVRMQVVGILSQRKDNFVKNCLNAHLKIEKDDMVKQRIAEALKEQVEVKRTTG